MAERYDAIVVGARVAGSTLATRLATAGWRVLLVDRDRFPSDTVSTHVIFPDTLEQLAGLGALQRLTAEHHVSQLRFHWRVLGHEVAGTFTPVGGFDRAICVRRVVLDDVLLQGAAGAGAEIRLGAEATGFVGAGTPDDPVRGAVIGGRPVAARWVLGADGRTSSLARHLGLVSTDERRGEMSFLYAYWRGLPPTDRFRLDVHEHAALMSTPCEDGLHLLSVAGPPDFTRGSAAVREERYRETLRRFPAVLNPRLLDSAERVTPLVVVPESMMRGYYRSPAGPGWALVGDAGHFKHPATAQGIGDAVQQARYVATALVERNSLDGYPAWRDARAQGHYDWSFKMARFGNPEDSMLYAGLANDPMAGQQFLDTFTKTCSPSEVVTRQRYTRWEAASAYEDGLRAVRTLVEDLPPERLALTVPACPDWSVLDLVRHLVGVAEDSAHGAFLPDAPSAWRDPATAAERERWTAGHVAARGGHDRDKLLGELDLWGGRVVAMLRDGTGFDGPRWLVGAHVADLGAHLHDLQEALGVAVAHGDAATRLAFRIYRDWLGARIRQTGLPALRLSDGVAEWVLGDGEPTASLTAERTELFRAITGRRSEAQIRSHAWTGDPGTHLQVLAPYPLPT